MSVGSTDASSASQPSSPGGTESNAVVSTETSLEPQKNSVAYDTHRRLLDEKKKLQEKYEQLATEKAARERAELEAKGEYQKIIEIERKQKAEAEGRLAELENTFLQGKKVKAFLGALGTGLDEKFYGFLPLEDIVVDPSTKEINMTSVAAAAESFKKSYPELLKTKTGVTLPNAAPAGNSANTITRDEWLKLSSKEMLKYSPSQILGA